LFKKNKSGYGKCHYKKKYVEKNFPGSFSVLPAFSKTNKYEDVKQIRRILTGIDAYTLHRSVENKFKTQGKIDKFKNELHLAQSDFTANYNGYHFHIQQLTAANQ